METVAPIRRKYFVKSKSIKEIVAGRRRAARTGGQDAQPKIEART